MKAKSFVGLILPILLLASFALANPNQAKNLAARADKISCTIDFHNLVMQSIAEKVGAASGLNAQVAKLQGDETQIKSLASSGDSKAFEDFTMDTLRPDIKTADESVRDARKNFKSYNVTKETRQSLKDSFKSAQDAFKTCISQNDLKIAEQKVNYYNMVLDNHQEQLKKLANKSVDTSQLLSLITEARTVIVTPLENAVKSANAAQAQAALKQYCLWSGCKNGTNFHFAAKFEQARLSALLAKITPLANAANLQSEVSSIQTQIDASKSALALVGSSDLTKETKDQVWNPLKSALQSFKKLVMDLRKSI